MPLPYSLALHAHNYLAENVVANLKMTIFDVQTSYGGQKVSEFNQEFNAEVKIY